MSLIGDERVINLQRAKVYVFSDSVLCLGKIHEKHQSNDSWEDRLGWFKSSQVHGNFDRIDGEPMEFEWNIFPEFNTLQLSEEVKILLLRLGETPENFTQEELYSCRCSTISPVDQKTMKKNASQMLDSFLYMQEDLEQDNGHFSVLVQRKSGKLSIHCCADLETIETIFRITISVNQLSLYGAVAEMCEEYESLHNRTGQPVVGGQSSSSFVPSVIKTEVPSDCDDLAHKDLLLQQYGERIEKLSQQDKMSKFCMDAGFLSVVEIGQCFMTKDTAEFSQFMQWPVVSTLFQETKKHHNQKDGSKEAPKLDPYWKLHYVTCTESTELR